MRTDRKERLRQWRQLRGWTQEELASRLSTETVTVGRTRYAQWESGRVEVPAWALSRLKDLGFDGGEEPLSRIRLTKASARLLVSILGNFVRTVQRPGLGIGRRIFLTKC